MGVQFFFCDFHKEQLDKKMAPALQIVSKMMEMKGLFNFHAGGMAVVRPYGFEIDFVRNPFS